MRSHGYKRGGTVGDLINRSGEDGFILARTGEEVLSLEKIQALGEAFGNIDSVMEKMTHATSPEAIKAKMNGSHHATNVDTINFAVTLPNVENYEDFKHEMQHDKNFENMIQDMTINRLFGGSALKKYKYN